MYTKQQQHNSIRFIEYNIVPVYTTVFTKDEHMKYKQNIIMQKLCILRSIINYVTSTHVCKIRQLSHDTIFMCYHKTAQLTKEVSKQWVGLT